MPRGGCDSKEIRFDPIRPVAGRCCGQNRFTESTSKVLRIVATALS